MGKIGTTTMEKLSKKSERIIKKFGVEMASKAYALHEQGNGGRGVGFELNVTTNQADALINAGRELAL